MIAFDSLQNLLQLSRFIINDTYRSELCLLYPPHLIAIAALYLTLVLHPKTRAVVQGQCTPARRSSRQARPMQDFVGWLAGLHVSHTLVATIAQEIIGLYALWERYREDAPADTDANSARGSFAHGVPVGAGQKRSAQGSGIGYGDGEDGIVTPAMLSKLLLNMRKLRMEELAHPPSGRPVVNKMLERAQAAG
jgi:cyclin-C